MTFRPPHSSTLFPYTTLFRSGWDAMEAFFILLGLLLLGLPVIAIIALVKSLVLGDQLRRVQARLAAIEGQLATTAPDRKSTRLNSSHEWISYAVFCLKKKNRI